MPIQVLQTQFPGLLLVQPEVLRDDRGYFQETYHRAKYSFLGEELFFVQDNHSHSIRNVVRGMHYQLRHPQGKLVHVVKGEILDVALDLRRGSPTFGKCYCVSLSEINKLQLFIPPGFAHGFAVTSATTDVIYKCTDFYFADDEFGVLWSDLPVEWPIDKPLLSKKDASFSRLRDIPPDRLPTFTP